LSRVLLADLLRGANWPGSEKAVNRDRCSRHAALIVAVGHN